MGGGVRGRARACEACEGVERRERGVGGVGGGAEAWGRRTCSAVPKPAETTTMMTPVGTRERVILVRIVTASPMAGKTQSTSRKRT